MDKRVADSFAKAYMGNCPADIPEDVWCLKGLMQLTYCYFGKEKYEWAQKVIADNPKHFPWETKYNSLPQEVHDAYRNEVDPDWNKPIDFDLPKIGLRESIKATPITPLVTRKDFEDMMIELADIEQRQKDDEQKEYNRRKKIWNKHYGKYKLEYRG